MSEMMLGKDDLIRRQDAIKALEKWKEGEARTVKDYSEVFVLGRTSAFADAIAAMVFVPSAEPERKRGKWKEKHHAYADEEKIIEEWQSCKCSVCGRYDTRPYMYYFDEPHFCSWCGADMRGGEHEAD